MHCVCLCASVHMMCNCRIHLNSTLTLRTAAEYHLGVCVNPWKGSDTSDDCCVVKRTGKSGDYVDVCIGRSIEVQFVDQRGQFCN